MQMETARIAPVQPDAERLEQARLRLAAELGPEAFRQNETGLAEFRDPFEGPGAVRHQPAFVVQPGSVAEVQAAVRIAAEAGVHVWTSSMGRNFGYGGSAPAVNGGVVLNLRRMNRVLEIDVPNACVRIEPGVTFQQLYDELRAQDAPLMMSVPDLGWGSMTGNALEHGYGYNVMGDHGSAVCGLEVVLADGQLVRTGQGAITGSPLWSCHRRGFGPSIDELFKQSNLGIVTQLGVWLMPRPEMFSTGTIQCEGDEDIVPLLDLLRENAIMEQRREDSAALANKLKQEIEGIYAEMLLQATQQTGVAPNPDEQAKLKETVMQDYRMRLLQEALDRAAVDARQRLDRSDVHPLVDLVDGGVDRACRYGRPRPWLWRRRQACAGDREFHEERCARPARRLESDASAMFADDGIGHREAEPGPLADFLRREERVEDLRLHVARDAGAVVVDLEDDALAFRVVPCADDEDTAAVGGEHRLFRVDDQVEQDLLDLVRVREHEG